ncbi:MAG TPA: hypothetical protein VKO20_08700, partial [Desulfosalsimonadaceae bacterium]|nr:hypothetical protein [Desulfosalsimonadaceae bacterium]
MMPSFENMPVWHWMPAAVPVTREVVAVLPALPCENVRAAFVRLDQWQRGGGDGQSKAIQERDRPFI